MADVYPEIGTTDGNGWLKSQGGYVYLTAEEMAEVDRMSIEDFGIDVLSLMENAGVRTAELARRMLGGSPLGKDVYCLVGRGNNGGDGLVAARHLHDWGARVTVMLGQRREELREIPAKQLVAVEKIGAVVAGPDVDLGSGDLVIDALLGYGSRGDPREPTASLITWANSTRIRTLAVDIPSGLDATTGEPGNPCIKASATLTFGLPKTGFLNPRAKEFLGELYLADISLPRQIYSSYPMESDIFSSNPVLRIW